MSDSNQNVVRTWLSVAACVVAISLMVAADLWTKDWATENLSRARFTPTAQVCSPDENGYISPARVGTAPKVVVENFFELRYAENCGAAFGLFNDNDSIVKKIVFIGAALIATLVMLIGYRQGRGGRWYVVAAATISAGAIGNLSDRARLGYVVDFIRFYRGTWEYPTFNIADVAITVGVVALLVDGFLEDRRERAALKAQRAATAAAATETPTTVTDTSDTDAPDGVVAESEATPASQPVEPGTEPAGGEGVGA